MRKSYCVSNDVNHHQCVVVKVFLVSLWRQHYFPMSWPLP